MCSFIEINITNFMSIYSKTIRLELGSNLISGRIGSGKSTIIRAIYFCLYGGRKFADIANDNHKNEGSQVCFHFSSPEKEYIIIRTRPSEKVKVQFRMETGISELTGDSAQGYINSIFGVEETFIASSMIAQKKSHFLIDSTNADNINLLQQITFGDLTLHNQVEPYLAKIKRSITNSNNMSTTILNDLNVLSGIYNNFLSKNNKFDSTLIFDDNDITELIKQHPILTEKYNKLVAIKPSILLRRDLENKLKLLSKVNIDQINSQIQKNHLYILYLTTKEKVKNFDTDYYNVDMQQVKQMLSIYEIHRKNSLVSIEEFHKEVIKMHEDYNNYLELKEKIDKVKREREQKKRINEQQINTYNLQYNAHKISIQQRKDFFVKKEQLESELKSISEINYNIDESLLTNLTSYLHFQCKRIVQRHSIITKFSNFELLNGKFDIDVLNYTESQLKSDLTIYDHFLKFGKTTKSEIELFVEEQKKQKELYSQFVIQKNNYLKQVNENKKKQEYNENTKQKYIKNQKVIEEYKSELYEIETKLSELDLDENTTISEIYQLNQLISEHNCPHCSNGIIITMNGLVKGNSTASEKINYQNQINNLTIKLQKYKELKGKYDNFLKSKPNEMAEPQYYEIEEIEEPENICENICNIFNLPVIEYDKLQSIYKSFHGKSIYEEYMKEMKSGEILYDPNMLSLYNQFNSNFNLSFNCEFSTHFTLVDGKIVFCENNDILYYIQNWNTITNEIKKQYDNKKKIKNINNQLSQYVNPPIVVEQPIYPELFELENIEEITIKQKPHIAIFNLPELSLDKVISLINSENMISHIEKLKTLTIYEGEFSINQLNEQLDKLNKELTIANMNNMQFDTLTQQLSGLPKDIPNIENEINDLFNTITDITQKYNKYQLYVEYKDIVDKFNNKKSEYDNLLINISKMQELYKHIEEVGRVALQEKLDEVNTSLRSILEEIFESHIEVELSSTKEMVKGGVKFQIHFNVMYKGINIAKLERLSGGEENIVSIALLLAFSRLNTNPLIMMDEVMASLDADMREKCMKVITRWTYDKFFINICHEIPKTFHENIIEIN